MTCEWCHQGEYRHCEATDWHTNPNAIRYGYTSADTAPHLWGGFAHYLYAPWNAVVHKVPANVTAELAGIATPLANGIQWALFEAGGRYGAIVLDQGPGPPRLGHFRRGGRVGRDSGALFWGGFGGPVPESRTITQYPASASNN